MRALQLTFFQFLLSSLKHVLLQSLLDGFYLLLVWLYVLSPMSSFSLFGILAETVSKILILRGRSYLGG